jgi:hypothetical protein
VEPEEETQAAMAGALRQASRSATERARIFMGDFSKIE